MEKQCSICQDSNALLAELKKKQHEVKRLQRDLKANRKRVHQLKTQKTKLLLKLAIKNPKNLEKNHRFFSRLIEK